MWYKTCQFDDFWHVGSLCGIISANAGWTCTSLITEINTQNKKLNWWYESKRVVENCALAVHDGVVYVWKPTGDGNWSQYTTEMWLLQDTAWTVLIGRNYFWSYFFQLYYCFLIKNLMKNRKRLSFWNAHSFMNNWAMILSKGSFWSYNNAVNEYKTNFWIIAISKEYMAHLANLCS